MISNAVDIAFYALTLGFVGFVAVYAILYLNKVRNGWS